MDGNSRNDVEKLYKERWQLLNILCSEYYGHDGSEKSIRLIFRNVRERISKKRTRKSLQLIEEELNLVMSDIIARIREECAFLNEGDIAFLSLVIAGLSTKTICVLMEMKPKTYYNRRKRLCDKIRESNAVSKDLFLSKIGREK